MNSKRKSRHPINLAHPGNPFTKKSYQKSCYQAGNRVSWVSILRDDQPGSLTTFAGTPIRFAPFLWIIDRECDRKTSQLFP